MVSFRTVICAEKPATEKQDDSSSDPAPYEFKPCVVLKSPHILFHPIHSSGKNSFCYDALFRNEPLTDSWSDCNLFFMAKR